MVLEVPMGFPMTVSLGTLPILTFKQLGTKLGFPQPLTL